MGISWCYTEKGDNKLISVSKLEKCEIVSTRVLLVQEFEHCNYQD